MMQFSIWTTHLTVMTSSHWAKLNATCSFSQATTPLLVTILFYAFFPIWPRKYSFEAVSVTRTWWGGVKHQADVLSWLQTLWPVSLFSECGPFVWSCTRAQTDEHSSFADELDVNKMERNYFERESVHMCFLWVLVFLSCLYLINISTMCHKQKLFALGALLYFL